MKHILREFKRELQVWHVLITCVMVGITAIMVIRSGSARYLSQCHTQAEDFTRQQVVQKLEELPTAAEIKETGEMPQEESLYMRAYRRCLTEVGIRQ